eukprot:11573498-Alexandrium_andersonii.AAC.1
MRGQRAPQDAHRPPAAEESGRPRAPKCRGQGNHQLTARQSRQESGWPAGILSGSRPNLEARQLRPKVLNQRCLWKHAGHQSQER